MSFNPPNSVFQNYPTDPSAYLYALEQQSGSPEDSFQNTIQGLIQEVRQMLQQLVNAGAGATPGAGAPQGAGAAPSPLPGGSMPWTGGATGGAGQMTAQSASGALDAYMQANNVTVEDPNELYELAVNANGNTPQTDQEAAEFMLQNPGMYEQIETHDVPGADGLSGIGNFQWAAQGGLGAEGNMPGVGATLPMTGAMPPMTGLMPGTMPYTTPAATPGTSGDLVNDGKPLQQAGEGQALEAFSKEDPTAFGAFESALSQALSR